jgi:hypothetical protein
MESERGGKRERESAVAHRDIIQHTYINSAQKAGRAFAAMTTRNYETA